MSRLFADPVREGVLALGVSSTEVAAVGLVGLAGGSTVLALGALTGSLVVSALAGPPLLSLLAGGTEVGVGDLVGRFVLVVPEFRSLRAHEPGSWPRFRLGKPRTFGCTAFGVGTRSLA